MNIPPSRAEGFVRNPDPAVCAVLVYGPDYGLVRIRADAIVTTAGDPADPFATVDLAPARLRSDPAQLADEAAAYTFSGKRKVVRVRDATDAVSAAFEGYLAAPVAQALVVVEAAELSKRSGLRTLFERSGQAAALACYPEEGDTLLRSIEAMLTREKLAADADALELIAASTAADHALLRGELEKLALYKQGSGTISVEDVRACLGDTASATLDAVAGAAFLGDFPSLDRDLQRVLVECQPVAVLRGAARHVQRLLVAVGLTGRGHSPDKAMEALRPPVFRRDRDRFRRQMRAWSADRLSQALEILIEAELDCKTTGLPAEAICQRALMRIAQAAAASRR